MGSELELFEHTNEQVIVTASPVVETMALMIAAVTSNNEHIFEDSPQLFQIVEQHSFASILKQIPPNLLYNLLNYLLPIPQLASVETFANKLSDLKDEFVVYYFWDEEVELEIVKRLIEKPSTIKEMERTYYWENDKALQFAETFLSNVAHFKQQLADILMKIDESTAFQQLLEAKTTSIKQAMMMVEKLNLEPLARAQYIMGKTFRRVHNYKVYYFIPSHCISPKRVRIFNNDVCYVIFGSALPIVDSREKSEQLTKRLKAISDPNRLLMLRMLVSNKEYGAKLAEYLGITTATVSHHIEILKKANLVTEEKIGTIKYFTANKEEVNELLRSMQQFLKA
ncbi:ArsR/SmtB family transcription factor [Solibacillus silvestris]|uniref:ArsR/SmtB family transcription factor n=1 Tax=Solibacillus silvestris TaxID=76853 RepID=UPI003F7EDABE